MPRAPLILAVLLLAGCFAAEPSTEPTFDVALTPGQLPYAFAGQAIVLVLGVSGGAGGAPVQIEARAPGAAVGVQPAQIQAPGIAEITVVPDIAQVGGMLDVTVSATRGDERREANVSFEVADPMTPPLEKAAEVRERFAEWLAQAHPELGVAPNQAWAGSFARPNIVVVSYYAFYSEDWEMGVRWHVMIPPYDWGEAYLRPRFQSSEPTMQWKIDSLSADPPQAPRTVPTEGVWR